MAACAARGWLHAIVASCSSSQTNCWTLFFGHKFLCVLLSICAKSCSKIGSALKGDFHVCVSKGLCCSWETVLLCDNPSLAWFGKYPYLGLNRLSWSHHSHSLVIFSAPEALSAHQTWLTSLTLSFKFLIRGMVAKAYIGMASGSPWVVPSWDRSTSPSIHTAQRGPWRY